MSYFESGIAYIIVPDTSISEEMRNNVKKSFNTKATERTTISGTDKTLFKVRTPVSAVFNGYVWYNNEDIKIEMAKTEWEEAEVL